LIIGIKNEDLDEANPLLRRLRQWIKMKEIEKTKVARGMTTPYPLFRCQFHQHFTHTFFVRKCFSLVTFWQQKALSYKKCVQKMLMKLTAGVKFINVLQAAFSCVDPKSTKNAVESFLHIKAARKTFLKLTPDVNFTNL